MSIFSIGLSRGEMQGADCQSGKAAVWTEGESPGSLRSCDRSMLVERGDVVSLPAVGEVGPEHHLPGFVQPFDGKTEGRHRRAV